MSPLAIRSARRDDLQSLIRLFAADSLGGHGDTSDPALLPAYEAAFDAIAASAEETLYVAERDGRLVGTFQLGLRYSLPHRGALKAILEAVQVDPALRGGGIGEEMVRFAIAEARKAGAVSIALTTNVARERAHRFYERLGFVPTHRGYKLFLE
ncbi:GNAT family N-acetyltransferase [Afifella pfennigii]|uniref:GNAT family N-acetyltransferase n=1 Tax=Afifella pfennigii TaxID=209897 RepID=UPI0005535CFB|nr:GNAT family N-acetyltransferase [Afifella pfennigii]